MKKLAALSMAVLMVVLMAGCQVIRAEAFEKTSIPEGIKNLVFGNAGASETEVYDREVEFDDGNYEIEFKKDGVEYEYEVNAETGKIVESEKDHDDDRRENKTSAESKKSERITASEALKIALSAAGLSESEVYDKDVDFDDGKYEVEFEKDGVEYEYEIGAKTGKILDVEIDRVDDWYDDDRDDDDWDDDWDD